MNPINRLPQATEVHGVMLYPEGNRDLLQIQYSDQSSQIQEVRMPVDAALWLTYLLTLMVKDAKLADRLKAVVKDRVDPPTTRAE